MLFVGKLVINLCCSSKFFGRNINTFLRYCSASLCNCLNLSIENPFSVSMYITFLLFFVCANVAN